ncbi:hypothetical protein [Bacillus sp. B15-48]|uniref:hypothetical protein n=1 Tax=Bacillus sp. B15-48 TaxID=1548601 RepID=UPI00193F3128|nr:hypothetical protein [Bacillus sp. B15-48]MBM4764977.1 hypothetical protein [Bacillus sp. B15-48]
MRKIILKVVMLISVLVLTACGSNATSRDFADRVYTLNYNVITPDISDKSKAHYYAMKWFPEELEERSEGRILVNVYFNGQLAQLPEMLDAVATGLIDMGYATASY